MEPILNERSVEAADRPMMERAATLLSVLRALDALGFPKVLRHSRDAIDREVESGITFRTWLFQRAPRETRQFLAGRLQKAPFIEALHQMQEDARDALLQVTYDGSTAAGVGTAFLYDAPAVALRGDARWEADPLVALLVKVDAASSSVEEVPIEVVHLCRQEQIEPRRALLRARVLRAVRGGDELWQRRREIFSRLDFCESVERQIRALSGHEFYFQHVVQALARLDTALVEWASGPLHPGMDFSTESGQTLNHGTYGPMRDFVCPDLEKRRFKNHLKIFSNNWRIYYLECRASTGEGRAYIGYAGSHLPTVNYPT
jgi:hypothetical protein